jgi:TRAP-type C4-dicarboxylate transport system permease small subunit
VGETTTGQAAEQPSPPPLYPLFVAFALAGCVALAACAVVTVVSVLGRFLFSAPIPGDIEIVALLMGAGVSLCLPYCQIKRGNVLVDVFTHNAPRQVRAALDLLGCLTIAAIGAVLAWRMALGGIELRSSADETMVLRLPTWIAFPFIVPSMALLAVAGIIGAWQELRTLARRKERA